MHFLCHADRVALYTTLRIKIDFVPPEPLIIPINYQKYGKADSLTKSTYDLAALAALLNLLAFLLTFRTLPSSSWAK